MEEWEEMSNEVWLSRDLRAVALQIFHRTLAAIDVASIVRNHLSLRGDRLQIGESEYDLTDIRRIVIIAIGKAGVTMARAVEAILGDRITEGLVVSNAVMGELPERMRVVIGGHPLPDQGSLTAAETALQMLRAADGEETLIIFLISGGGSALFEKPVDERITLEDLQVINRVLVGCGAVIAEMNIVRRLLSSVKGGRLAAAAPLSQQISLYISDVNSDNLSTVSSGPTLPGSATRAEFERLVARYNLLEKFPAHVSALITSGSLLDPLQAGRGSHHLLLDNRLALLEAERIAEEEFRCTTEIADDLVEGEVAEMAHTHIERIKALRDQYRGKTVCLLSGGEVICPVRGSGQGGRNQEFVLRAAIALEEQGEEELVVLSAGTDGIDGNSPAAGAIADLGTVRRARAQGISPELYLDNSDSFNFFDRLGEAILTGPTGNNVRDLRILLAR
jgi:glycerate 2-kinase